MRSSGMLSAFLVAEFGDLNTMKRTPRNLKNKHPPRSRFYSGSSNFILTSCGCVVNRFTVGCSTI